MSFNPEAIIPRLEEVLHASFGIDSFRTGQREVVEAILRGRDALVLMPTGSGKSLCYQLPALILPGLTLVVSPLIALMKDQVDSLQSRGLPATFINSTVSAGDQYDRIRAAASGSIKLLFVAPERFKVPQFMEAMQRLRVSLLAVDEAHCISQWGHNFRPDYLKLADARQALGKPTTVALTATATPFVRRDIGVQLQLDDPEVLVFGFERHNLFLQVAKVESKRAKIATAAELACRPNTCGIIYCSTQKKVEELGPHLAAAGARTAIYHAGLRDTERERVQNEFMSGNIQCLIATNAFGMGVDKSDLRYVVHYDLPGSLEAYYQEAGRAGRDGEPAHCLMLYNYADTGIHEFFINNSFPEPWLIQSVYRLLSAQGVNRLITSTTEDLKKLLGKKAHDMAIQTALRLLRAAGHIEKVEEPKGWVVLDKVDPKRIRVDTLGLQQRAEVEHERLRKVVFYATGQRCRTLTILDYFGSRIAGRTGCGHCDNCTTSETSVTAAFTAAAHAKTPKALKPTKSAASSSADSPIMPSDGLPPPEVMPCKEPARTVIVKILACVARLKAQHDVKLAALVLTGSKAARVITPGLDQISTYGLLGYLRRRDVSFLVEQCRNAKLISLDARNRASLTVIGTALMTSPQTPLPELLSDTLKRLFPFPPRSIEPWRPG